MYTLEKGVLFIKVGIVELLDKAGRKKPSQSAFSSYSLQMYS